VKIGDLVKYGLHLGLVIQVASCTEPGWMPGSVLVRFHAPAHPPGVGDNWYSTSALEIVNASR
jgi:hypothetical protein